jgi:hypothetical protein
MVSKKDGEEGRKQDCRWPGKSASMSTHRRRRVGRKVVAMIIDQVAKC